MTYDDIRAVVREEFPEDTLRIHPVGTPPSVRVYVYRAMPTGQVFSAHHRVRLQTLTGDAELRRQCVLLRRVLEKKTGQRSPLDPSRAVFRAAREERQRAQQAVWDAHKARRRAG